MFCICGPSYLRKKNGKMSRIGLSRERPPLHHNNAVCDLLRWNSRERRELYRCIRESPLPLSTGKREKKGTGRIIEKFAMRRVIHRRQLFVLRLCVYNTRVIETATFNVKDIARPQHLHTNRIFSTVVIGYSLPPFLFQVYHTA